MAHTAPPSLSSASADGAQRSALGWVLQELQTLLESANHAFAHYVREVQAARGQALTELDTSALRLACQQLHQGTGALEMVGLSMPAKLLQAVEAVAQQCVQQPQTCNENTAVILARANRALLRYLAQVLAGQTRSPVLLFSHYRQVLELAQAERIHPADLWPTPWHWPQQALLNAQALPDVERIHYASDVRNRMDYLVLKMVKTGQTQGALPLAELCVGLALGESEALTPEQSTSPAATFWTLAAAYFEALGRGGLALDIYNKRTASRVLQQYALLAKGERHIAERLVQDLFFFCAMAAVPQAHHPTQAAPSALAALHAAYPWHSSHTLPLQPVAYADEHFSTLDPAHGAWVREQLHNAIETWAAVAQGDLTPLTEAQAQWDALQTALDPSIHSDAADSLLPAAAVLVQALNATVQSCAAAQAAPSAALAMEAATSMLYLSSLYQDPDTAYAIPTEVADRAHTLAARLQRTQASATLEPLESWMEALYRRMGERRTLDSVAHELHSSLLEVEHALDQYFRAPQNAAPLSGVGSKLDQMRGVFSLMNLQPAVLAVQDLQQRVGQWQEHGAPAEGQSAAFETVGNTLSALGLLINMLAYQQNLAEQLFVYDPVLGTLRTRMEPDASDAPHTPTPLAAPAPAPAPAVSTSAVAASDSGLGDEDTELLGIFLDEAREVLHTSQDSLHTLNADPGNLSSQSQLRRAFHTLKGSARMVGLDTLGEAAWAFEQLLNACLAEQQALGPNVLAHCTEALDAMGRWVEDIARQQDSAWQATAFREAADALRQGHSPAVQRLGPVSADSLEPAHATALAADAVDSAQAAKAPASAGTPLIAPQIAPAVVAPIAIPVPAPSLIAAAATPASPPPLAGTDPAPSSPPVPTRPAAVSVLEIQVLPAKSAPTPAADATVVDTAHEEAAPQEAVPHVAQAAHETEQEPAQEAAAPELAPTSAPESEVPLPASALPNLDPDSPRSDEDTKVIGPLRLSIRLYNVYLNEADEWSRRLQTELSEWALESAHRVLPSSCVDLVHALLGSSATVGFRTLAELARALESALQHVHVQGHAPAQCVPVFNRAAEEIRHLLHQFAAGFLKTPPLDLLQALNTIASTDWAAHAANDTTSNAAPPSDYRNTAAAEHDDLDTPDADLFDVFEEEAAELLPALGTALRQWAAQPQDTQFRAAALRVLHTLKGSARLAGAARLGEGAHDMESRIEALDVRNADAADIEPVLASFDELQQNFERLRAHLHTPQHTQQQANLPELAASDESAAMVASEAVAHSAASARSAAHVITAPAAPLTLPRAIANQTVRVRAPVLDRLVNQVGEVMISRSRLEERLGQVRGSAGDLDSYLQRLRQQLRELEVQAESQMQSRLAQSGEQSKNFDPLEFDRFTRVQELTRMMAESVDDLTSVQRNLLRQVQASDDELVAQSRQTRSLQRDLLRTRMVEFEAIADRLYSVVRQAAKDTGKQVRLDIVGGSMEMDRGVLDRMASVFEHILRNAVAHGIEPAAQRVAAGKPAAGQITIELQQESNDISVRMADDGAGLSLERIRQQAIARDLISADAVLDDAALTQLLFLPGFSTAEEVTELAGRGIGMDVVLSEVNALGGRIETTSTPGLGTQFRLVLPLTTAVTQVVMLRMGEFSIGVPANLMETVLRVPASALQQAQHEGQYTVGDQAVPFFWAGALLQHSGASSELGNKHVPVALFRSAGQRLALQVDEVLGNREVVVKNLGPQLMRMPGLTGMSVLPSGAVVLIYNPVALAAVYGEAARAWQAAVLRGESAPAPAPLARRADASQAPLVLVVDDSITVRRVTQRLLQREGYRVITANDGLQALEKLHQERPRLLITDIEMPRMDGFDLVRNLRADLQLAELPVVMITSRIAEKHRAHADTLRVNHYLGKPYAEDALLALVRTYCSSGAAL